MMKMFKEAYVVFETASNIRFMTQLYRWWNQVSENEKENIKKEVFSLLVENYPLLKNVWETSQNQSLPQPPIKIENALEWFMDHHNIFIEMIKQSSSREKILLIVSSQLKKWFSEEKYNINYWIFENDWEILNRKSFFDQSWVKKIEQLVKTKIGTHLTKTQPPALSENIKTETDHSQDHQPGQQCEDGSNSIDQRAQTIDQTSKEVKNSSQQIGEGGQHSLVQSTRKRTKTTRNTIKKRHDKVKKTIDKKTTDKKKQTSKK